MKVTLTLRLLYSYFLDHVHVQTYSTTIHFHGKHHAWLCNTFCYSACSFDRLTVCCILFDLKMLQRYLFNEYERVAFLRACLIVCIIFDLKTFTLIYKYKIVLPFCFYCVYISFVASIAEVWTVPWPFSRTRSLMNLL